MAQADALFARCLPLCPNVDLWRLYLHHVQVVSAPLAPNIAYHEVVAAFEHTLSNVGPSPLLRCSFHSANSARARPQR